MEVLHDCNGNSAGVETRFKFSYYFTLLVTKRSASYRLQKVRNTSVFALAWQSCYIETRQCRESASNLNRKWSGIRIRINLDSDTNVRQITLKLLRLHYLVDLNDFAKFCDKKLSCRRETVRCCASLNISMSLNVTQWHSKCLTLIIFTGFWHCTPAGSRSFKVI